MLKVIRTNSRDSDFVLLVKQLDEELAIRDGEDHAFYHQFNKLINIKYVVILYENERPVGCGAIKEYGPGEMEVKRMFVLPEKRGEGLASIILTSLERWAAELSYTRCILETGFKQPEAISLYKKNGYNRIPNYGQYAGVKNSLCFLKEIKMTD